MKRSVFDRSNYYQRIVIHWFTEYMSASEQFYGKHGR